MKICRFLYKNNAYWGLVDSGYVIKLKIPPYTAIKPLRLRIPLNRVKLLPPATPTKIILVGLNYKDHARELGMPIPSEPIIFLKPPSALIGHKEAIRYPQGVKRLDYEGELAVIIKKEARSVPVRKAAEYILGYSCLNDVTARDLQKKDGQWSRAKSFDTFCPLGPWCETNLNFKSCLIQTYLNGELKQHSSTRQFIFPVNRLIAFISKIMTLYPGDVVSTGTPAGVGPMKRADTVCVDIQGIGVLENTVV